MMIKKKTDIENCQIKTSLGDFNLVHGENDFIRRINSKNTVYIRKQNKLFVI